MDTTCSHQLLPATGQHCRACSSSSKAPQAGGRSHGHQPLQNAQVADTELFRTVKTHGSLQLLENEGDLQRRALPGRSRLSLIKTDEQPGSKHGSPVEAGHERSQGTEQRGRHSFKKPRATAHGTVWARTVSQCALSGTDSLAGNARPHGVFSARTRYWRSALCRTVSAQSSCSHLTLQLGGVPLSRDAALLPTDQTRADGQLTVCSTSSKDLATK